MSRAEPAAQPIPIPSASRGPLVLALAAALAALATNAPALFYPLARDQGIFAYNTAALLDGAVPYRDFVDQKPPGILLLYAIPLALGGRTPLAIHLFEWAFLGATGVAAFHAGRRLAGDGAGVLAAAGTGLFHSPAVHGFWDRAQIESFLTLPYAAVFLLLAPAPGRPPSPAGRALRALGAGALTGAAFCLKPNAIAFPVLAMAAVIVLEWRRGEPGVPRRAGCFAAGFAAPPVALAGWLAAAGGLQPFLEHASAVNAAYLGSGLRITALRLVYGLAPVLGAFAAAAALVALFARRFAAAAVRRVRAAFAEDPGRPRLFLLFATLWIGAYASFASGRFLFPYHAQAIILPNALTLALAAPALGLTREVAARRRRLVGAVAAGGIVIALAIVAATLTPEDRAFLTGRLGLDAYHDSARFDQGDFSSRDDRALAREIHARTRPGEPTQVFGHGSLALFLAGRPSATRFSFTRTALEPRYGRDGADRQEILERLEADPPPLVAITSNDALIQFGAAASDEQVRAFPPLAEFIASRYRPVAQLGDHLLLERE